MATQIKKEVSLDSQQGGSLGNSRLTLSSRDTPLSLKSFEQVDQSVQVDLSADTITYDSDDEMVKRRVGILRNKKGHPIFSREDIREQYCINRKEVESLEHGRTDRARRLFGCLTGGSGGGAQEGSSGTPCSSKSSLLLSCMQKWSSKDSLREEEEDSRRAKESLLSPGEESRTLQDCSQDEDEFMEAGFRRRPKSFCMSEVRLKYSQDGDCTQETRLSASTSWRHPLSCSTSLGSASIENDLNVSGRGGAQRPSHLNIARPSDSGAGGSRSEAFSPDTPSEAGSDKKRNSVDILMGSVFGGSKTPDYSLEERRQKHVSFDSVSLVRSSTVGAGLEDADGGPVATSTPLNVQRKGSPDKNRSQERLLDRSARNLEPFERSLSRISGESAYSSQRSVCPTSSRVRRASMKTQATQTEVTIHAKNLLPAYLTLSPRATGNVNRKKTVGSRSRSKLSKSRSDHGALVSEDSEDEVMEVDLVSKHPRLIRPLKPRTSMVKQRAVETATDEQYTRLPIRRTHSDVTMRCARTDDGAAVFVRVVPVPFEDTPEILDSSKVESESQDADETLVIVLPDPVPISIQPEPPPPEPALVSRLNIPSESCRLVQSSSESTCLTAKANSFTDEPASCSVAHVSDLESNSKSDDTTTGTGTTTGPKSLQQKRLELEKKFREAVEQHRRSMMRDRQDSGTPGDIFLTSPESETSSGAFTERETSRSEISSSSSSWMPKSDAPQVSTGSSEYVTAEDHSIRLRKAVGSEGSHTSFETASSASLFSSPSSRSGGHAPSPPAEEFRIPPIVTVEEDKSSSDESTPKKSSDSESIDLSVEQPQDRQGTAGSGEQTPIAEPSPEPSSLLDMQTVIERSGPVRNRHSEETELTDSTTTDSTSGAAVSGVALDDFRLPLYVDRPPRSPEELSTVSEVSDEISQSDDLERNQAVAESLPPKETSDTSSTASSSSANSTTSGSFVLDNQSLTDSENQLVCLSEGFASSTSRQNLVDISNEQIPKPESEETISSAIEESLDQEEQRDTEGSAGDIEATETTSTPEVQEQLPTITERSLREGAIPKQRIRKSDHKKEPLHEHTKVHRHENHCLQVEAHQAAKRLGQDPKVLCSSCGEKIKDRCSTPSQGSSSCSPTPVPSTSTWRPPNSMLPEEKTYSRRPSHHRWGDEDLFDDEDEDAGVHLDSYRSTPWIYVSDAEELAVWKMHTSLQGLYGEGGGSGSHQSLSRTSSSESTASEQEFKKLYQSITHRMVHRKSSVEMYKRLANKSLDIDKQVVIQRSNGEFGFRIHGSRPVVVSAIERGTPAESCGLEIGDIILSINGVNVLEASHSEVVRIAHTGSDVLQISVARTCHVLTPTLTPVKVRDGAGPASLLAGYLQRLSGCPGQQQRWCRRWFVLKQDNCLYWYRSEKDSGPLGALVLLGQLANWVPDSGSPHAFNLSKPGGLPRYFAADDENTATRWISALNQVASTASQVDPYLETCLKGVQLPALSVPGPDCHGYLGKFGQRWKIWRRRYFVLKDACLYFYTDRGATVALGMFLAHGYKVQSCTVQNKKHTFEVVPCEPRLRHLHFIAESDNDKKRWLAALEYSIDRWIKVE